MERFARTVLGDIKGEEIRIPMSISTRFRRHARRTGI